ncbi:M15 family metallopeptidase [Bacillus suaedae]|uniref:M15 family metallopeptidase n=1 Tax=Halalkalibacter suaedae TaxID=2822140 RepID=A0A941AQF3_9BACI|nr:M15 family metallopeptidase [Bacillus suaedae]MBP3951118.1 M15 family metallopeptidase [Bacillus suaedae]
MNLNTLIERSQRHLANVHSYIAERGLEIVRRCHKEGIYVQITHGLRTISEQNALYAKGRTATGSIVTNAKGGYSYHNFGLAIDFVVLNSDGSANWTVDNRWRRMGAIGEALGLEWGGSWTSFKDYPHFQHTFGLTTAQLRVGVKPPSSNQPLPSSTTLGRDCSLYTCKGSLVTSLQKDLITLGEKLPRFGADGDFGKETEEATKAFQARYNLAVDGIAGQQTLNKIKSLIEANKPQSTPKKEEPFMLEKAIVINSSADYPAAEMAMNKLGAPVVSHTLASKQQMAKELFVIGGSKDGLKADKFTVLSGKNRFDTAEQVRKHIGL